MNRKRLTLLFVVVLCLVIGSVNAASDTLIYPSGFLGPGAAERFPFFVNNVTANHTFYLVIHNIEPDKYVIDGVVPNASFPGITVDPADTWINNAGALAMITLNSTGGVTATTPTPLVDVIFHATKNAGWSYPWAPPFMSTHDGVNFDPAYVFNGSIYSSGGMNPAIAGTIVAPTAVIPPDSEKIVKVRLGNIVNADNLSLSLWHTTPGIVITDVRLNSTVSGSLTANYEALWDNWYVDVNFLTPFTATTPQPVLDITVKTNTTQNLTPGEQGSIIFVGGNGQVPVWGRYPTYHVWYPFGEIQDGIIYTQEPGPGPGPGPGPAVGSELWFPVGSVGPGIHQIFPFNVTNLTGVTSVIIYSFFDPHLIVIDNITPNSSVPGVMIGPGTMVSHAGHYGMGGMGGMLDIAVIVPAGITVSSPTSLVDLHVRTAEQAGNMSPFNGTANYNDSTPFNYVWGGYIISEGGGNTSAGGHIIAPTGSVPQGGQATFSVNITNLTMVDEFVFSLIKTVPEAVNITQVVLSPGVTGNVTVYPDGAIYVLCSSGLTATATPLPLVDVTIQANSTSGVSTDIIFNTTGEWFMRPTWERYPGFPIIYPFKQTHAGTITIVTAGPVPIPAFTANRTSGQAPLAVQFDPRATDVYLPTAWIWNFGAGANPAASEQQNPPVVIYSTPGLKTVSLTVSNASGSNTTTIRDYITVTPPPAPPTTIIAPNGSVPQGRTVILPVRIANLTDVEGIAFNLKFNSTLLNISAVDPTAEYSDKATTYWQVNHIDSTTDVLTVGIYWVDFQTNQSANVSAGYPAVEFLDIEMNGIWPGISPLEFINYTVQPSPSSPVFFEAEWSRSNVSYPFDIKVNRSVNVLHVPDLVPVISNAPPVIRKENDDSVHFQVFYQIDNRGTAATTSGFVVNASLATYSSESNETYNIPAGGSKYYNYDIFIYNGPDQTIVTDDPVAPNIYNCTVQRWQPGGLSLGNKTVNVTVDYYDEIHELNETNNKISRSTMVVRPNLQTFLIFEPVELLHDSNTTYKTALPPGTYRILYWVANKGTGAINPTSLNVSINGVNTTKTMPALGPGQTWNGTWNGTDTSVTVNVNQYDSRWDLAVYANYDRAEKEGDNTTQDYLDDSRSITLSSFPAVTLSLPHVLGASDEEIYVPITLTNVSASSPVTNLSIPFLYDPTVSYIVQSHATSPNIVLNPLSGRLLISGNNLNIDSDTEIVNITMKARADAGRSSLLTSARNAFVKTSDGTAFLELNVKNGTFQQTTETDARVQVFVPTAGKVGTSQTVTVSVSNLRAAPVTVQANVTLANSTDTSEIGPWTVSLGPFESKTFINSSWIPAYRDVYWVNATITGDDRTDNNRDSRGITIEDYQLTITAQNKQYWDGWYRYNASGFYNTWFFIGTYYTANQAGMVNGTIRIWYDNGTEVDLSSNAVFDFWWWTPQRQRWYGYESNWNYMAWWVIPKRIGTYHYTISLEARGESDHVNGTLDVREPYVDIKVINATVNENPVTDTTLLWNVYNEPSAINKEVVIKAAAGSEGRTLQGLQWLTYYPYGCPEQTMSPTLATLRILQYYEKRDTLTEAMRDDLNSKILTGVQRMSAPDGDNGQQLAQYYGTYGDGSGGWAWGRWNSPSMFYTMYPNYVLSEVYRSNQSYWSQYIIPHISFNESVNWLINRQRPSGEWVEYGYIYDPTIWTGYTMVSFNNEYDFLNNTMKNRVNDSMNRAYIYLNGTSFASNDARAFTIMGLKGIENRIGNISLNASIDAKAAELTGYLLDPAHQHDTGGTTYWDGGGYWYVNNQYTTAQVLKALNATGIPGDNATILKGIRFLVGIYNTGGRWTNTATTAGVMEAILQLQPSAIVNASADITVYNADGHTVVKQENGVLFNNTLEGISHSWTLTDSELQTLFDGGTGTGSVIVTNWHKLDTGSDDVQLLVSADSRMKLPITIAQAHIDPRYIDPIADNFTLSISVPSDMKGGDSGNVSFTIHNNNATSTDQYVMTVQIPVNTNGVTFEGSSIGSNMSYYIGSDSRWHYLNHEYDATTGKLVFFPGSDNETRPSILAGESRTYYVPLKFGNSGNITVEARAFPMYNDEWMAIGNGTAYVKGFGNITLSAVNQTGVDVLADFYVGDMATPVASGTHNKTVNKVEGTYAIAIRNGTSWVNTSVNIKPGETTTYTAQFATDTSLPHITTVTGASGEVRIMSPTIEDTANASSSNHWNATQMALINYTSSISSSGGYVTLEVDLPQMARNRGTAYLNDNLTVSVHNTSGWFSYSDYTIAGDRVRINNVNTADIDQVSLGFLGRPLGDINNDKQVSITDVILIQRYLVFGTGMTGANDPFYADIDDSGGRVRLIDEANVLKYLVGIYNANYLPV